MVLLGAVAHGRYRYGPKLVDGERITLFLGNYGSGKTEVSVNFALHLAETRPKEGVALVDLDLVNPYFRSRESRDYLQARGVRVVIPATEYLHADLPILVPEVRAVLAASTARVILDVGGDDVGARVLGSLSDALPAGGYGAFMVLNANRPFAGDVAGVLRLLGEIEAASRCRVTGLISNTHLMGDTRLETVMAGYGLAREVEEATGRPLVCVCAPPEIVDEVRKEVLVEVLPIRRFLAPSWQVVPAERRGLGKDVFSL